MRKHSRACKRAIPFVGIRPIGDPIMGRKVNCFANIGAKTEASVEGSWERDDELALVLQRAK